MSIDKNHKDNHPTILFDGDCTMCNAAVQFILRHEKNENLKFSSLDKADDIFPNLKGSIKALPDAIHFLQEDKVLIESDAIIAISNYLSWPYSMVKYIKFIPKFLRDIAYRLVAKRRLTLQSLFKNSCDFYSDYSNRML